MAEPGAIRNGNLERIHYTTASGENGSAVVRKNRNFDDTMAQYARISANFPYGQLKENAGRYLKIADTFTRTLRAMSASGRPNPFGMPNRATRKTNRR